jgi:hypothetical protein
MVRKRQVPVIGGGATASVISINDQTRPAGRDRLRRPGGVFTVFGLEVTDGVVQAIRAVVNPDKLGHIGPVSDVARLPEKALPQHRRNTKEGGNR